MSVYEVVATRLDMLGLQFFEESSALKGLCTRAAAKLRQTPGDSVVAPAEPKILPSACLPLWRSQQCAVDWSPRRKVLRVTSVLSSTEML